MHLDLPGLTTRSLGRAFVNLVEVPESLIACGHLAFSNSPIPLKTGLCHLDYARNTNFSNGFSLLENCFEENTKTYFW